LRVVTSLYDEELPRDIKTHSGGTHPARRFGTFLGNFVRRPGSVIDTIKQKQRQLEAADVLADRIIKLLLRYVTGFLRKSVSSRRFSGRRCGYC
jgi:hypothetical protein